VKWRLLAAVSCVLLLSVLLLPGLSAPKNSTPVLPPLAAFSSKGGSTIQIQVNNAAGYCVAPSPDGNYLYIGGANWSNTDEPESWEPALWKYDSSGEQVWNTTLNTPGPKISPAAPEGLITGFLDVAVSPHGDYVYAVGQFRNESGSPNIDAILVKFRASDGTLIWNFTLSEKVHDYLYAVTVSPDEETVYVSGALSKSGGINSFYVAAINASNGDLLWAYELYEVSSGISYDLALSPSGDVLYAVGKYVDTQLVALNTSTGEHLWNLTTDTYWSIRSAKISSDGDTIHALAVDYSENYCYLTLSASDGSLLRNKTLDFAGYPYKFDTSSDDSKIYVTAHALGNERPILMAEYIAVSGSLSGVIPASDRYTASCDVAASGNNGGVYVVGYYENNIAGEHYMFLLEGYAEPVSSSLGLYSALLAYTMFSQFGASTQMSYYLIAGAGVLVVAVVAAYFLKTKRP